MIYYITALIILIICVCSLCVLYKKYIRPKFPAKVTCWFCGTRTSVPYVEANSFECPACEQYNGFNEDGDYNRTIPAQYDEMRNGSTPCKEAEYIGGVDILCDRCKQSQLLKTKQLANFVPYNEENYLWEVNAFERHMEKVYRLCGDCEEKVQKELGMQDEVIARSLNTLDSSDRTFHQIDNTDIYEHNSSIMNRPRNYRTIASRILHVVSLLCGLALLLCKVDSGQPYWPVEWSVMLQPVLLWLDRHAMMLAGAGLLSWVLAASLMYIQQSVSIFDVIGCPMWLFILLIQTGFIPYTDMSTMYDLACNVALDITCLLCLTLRRNRRDLMDIRMIRSPTVGPRPFQEELSESEEEEESTENDENSTRTLTDVSELTNRLSSLDSWINKGINNRTSQPHTHSGRLTPIRNNTPIIPRILPDARTRESHSISRRPLISPASFKYTSTPSRHKYGMESNKFGQNYGLFSVRGSVQANFDVRHVFSNQPKLLPERPATPIVQSFGVAPFQTFSLDRTDCFTTIDPLRSTEIVAEERRSSDIEEGERPEEVTDECGETVDNLVDRLVGLPVFSHKEPPSLSRSDSGYFSCVSDSDVQVSSVSSSQCDVLSSTPMSFGPRQLIRSATFEYQHKIPVQETVQPMESSKPRNVPERGWKTLENSQTLLPTHRYFTRFGSVPYKDIIISEET